MKKIRDAPFLIFLLLMGIAPIFTEDVTKTQLSNHILNDKSDPFNLLTESDLERDWSDEQEETLLSKIEHLDHVFVDVISIEVRLVGDVGASLPLIQKYLNSLVFDSQVTSTQFGKNVSLLNIRKKFLFQVTQAPPSINVVDRINNELRSGRTSLSESLLLDQFGSMHMSADATIFIVGGDRPTSERYTYSHNKTSSGFDEECPKVLGIGNQKFIWWDLRAGPLRYGVEGFREGAVEISPIPNTAAPSQIAEAIAAFVKKSLDFVVAPSLWRSPIHFTDIEVRLVRISNQHKPTSLFRWDKIYEQFNKSIPLLEGQTFKLTQKEVHLSRNPSAAQALAQSMKLGSPVKRLNTNERMAYRIDSTEMYHWVQQSKHGITGHFEKRGPGVRNVAIVLFDLDDEQERILMEQMAMAVAYEDVVIAVQSRTNQFSSEYQCDGDRIVTDPTDASPAVWNALLQTIWGIPPTYRRWSNVHHRIAEDYTFSGAASLGTYSNEISLNPFSRDAMLRHQLYSELDAILTEVNQLFTHFMDYGKEVDEVLSSSDHVQFVRRWNILQYKIGEASRYLSLNNYQSSYAFITSMRYDVASLHKLIHVAGKHLHTYLHCNKGEPSSIARYIKLGIISTPLLFLSAILILLARNAQHLKFKRI